MRSPRRLSPQRVCTAVAGQPAQDTTVRAPWCGSGEASVSFPHARHTAVQRTRYVISHVSHTRAWPRGRTARRTWPPMRLEPMRRGPAAAQPSNQRVTLGVVPSAASSREKRGRRTWRSGGWVCHSELCNGGRVPPNRCGRARERRGLVACGAHVAVASPRQKGVGAARSPKATPGRRRWTAVHCQLVDGAAAGVGAARWAVGAGGR